MQFIQRPPLSLLIREGIRSFKERVQSVRFRRTYQPQVLGDGHPVVVIPGFLAGELSTQPLREFITKIGYSAYDWNMGRNYARIENLPKLLKRLNRIYKKHQLKITLIGWSLGGVYARELAKRNPEIIRHVITMASPFKNVRDSNNISWVYEIMHSQEIKDAHEVLLADIPAPPPLPTTCIYSKTDGIVPWELCIEDTVSDLYENIEVDSPHLGMGFDREVLELIANLLAKY